MRKKLSLRVSGVPVPQGSMKPVRARNGVTYVTHNNERKLREYRARVQSAVAQQCPGEYFDEPISVAYVFHLSRPQRPRWLVPAVKPDLDKLVRAVNDAITGSNKRLCLLAEDSRIASVSARKQYVQAGEKPYTEIVISVGSSSLEVEWEHLDVSEYR